MINSVTEEELTALAQAMFEEGVTYYDPDCGAPHFFCQFCENELHGWDAKREDFKHDAKCPVLIAERILGKRI